jgi:hypothetical protein
MRRVFLLGAMFAFSFFGACVFHIKYQVSQTADALKSLAWKKEAIRENLQLLRAEWAHLNEPSRLEALAQKYLPLSPATVGQVKSLKASMDPSMPSSSGATDG